MKFANLQLKQFFLRYKTFFFLFSLICLAAFVILWGLGRGSLSAVDEAIYSEVSREMIEKGDWLTPHWNFVPWFHKPPLFFWATASFYKLFGVTLFWSRAASAFAGIGVVLVTYLIGCDLYSRRVGLLAGLVLLSSNGFIFYSRQGMVDVMLTLFLLCTCYFYVKSQNGSEKWWYLIGVSCGLAIMVKGAAGIVAPASVFLALLVDNKLFARFNSKHFWFSCLLSLAIISPWHLLMTFTHGQMFLGEYVGYHIIQRSTTAIEGNNGSYFYYVYQLVKQFSPWIYLASFAVVIAVKDKFQLLKSTTVLLSQLIIVFTLYTLAGTKLPNYIVPLYPLLSLIVARYLELTLTNFSILIFLSLLPALIGAGAIAQPEVLWSFFGLGLILIFVKAATRKKLAYYEISIFLMLFLFTTGIRTLRHFYGHQESPLAKISTVARQTQNDNSPLIVITEGKVDNFPAVIFYSERQVIVSDLTKQQIPIDENSKLQIISDKTNLAALEEFYDLEIIAEEDSIIYANLKSMKIRQ